MSEERHESNEMERFNENGDDLDSHSENNNRDLDNPVAHGENTLIERDSESSKTPPLHPSPRRHLDEVRSMIYEVISSYRNYRLNEKLFNNELWLTIQNDLQKDQLEAIASDAEEKTGYTALHEATSSGFTEMVNLLLDNGAGVHVDLLESIPTANPEQPQKISPLMYSVMACDIVAVQRLLPLSKHPSDALCVAITQYEEEKNPAIKTRRLEMLDLLLKREQITGKKESEVISHEMEDISHEMVAPARGCLNIENRLMKLRPLQLIATYRDKELFNRVLHLLPVLERGETSETQLLAGGKKTLFHLAVEAACLNPNPDPSFNKGEENKDLVFIDYLLSIELLNNLYYRLNDENKTALSIAVEYGHLEIVKKFAEKKVSLSEYTKSDVDLAKLKYLPPLPITIKNANDEMLQVLLDNWPEECKKILNQHSQDDQKQVSDIIRMGMHSWREKVLKNQDDSENVKVFKRLLTFDQANKVLNRQSVSTKKMIEGVKDTDLKKALESMWAQISSDCSKINYLNDESSVQLKFKYFGLLNALENVAQAFSGSSNEMTQKKAREEFAIIGRTLVYGNNKLITLFGVLLCALAGFIVGAIVGFVIGTIITGSPMGGFELGVPAAKTGLYISTILTGLFFGVKAGVLSYVLSDMFKWQRGLWSIEGAMERNVKNTRHDGGNSRVTYHRLARSNGSESAPLIASTVIDSESTEERRSFQEDSESMRIENKVY